MGRGVVTPSGMLSPPIVVPDEGTTRGSGATTPWDIRKLSLIMAVYWMLKSVDRPLVGIDMTNQIWQPFQLFVCQRLIQLWPIYEQLVHKAFVYFGITQNVERSDRKSVSHGVTAGKQ